MGQPIKISEGLLYDPTRVEALKSQLLRGRTTRSRFRFNLTPQEAFDRLSAAYALTVEERCGTTQFDQNTLRNIGQLAHFITATHPKFGVLFCGTCGNGKSTLMYAFRSTLQKLFENHHFDFLDNPYFKAQMRIYNSKELTQLSHNVDNFTYVKEIEMLGIDDLGEEPVEVLNYGNSTSPLLDLLEHRYNRQLFTMITTNLTPEEISAKYGQRITDRFREMLHIMVFDDISYRKSYQ